MSEVEPLDISEPSKVEYIPKPSSAVKWIALAPGGMYALETDDSAFVKVAIRSELRMRGEPIAEKQPKTCFECECPIDPDHEPKIASGQAFHPTNGHCISALRIKLSERDDELSRLRAEVEKLRAFAKDVYLMPGYWGWDVNDKLRSAMRRYGMLDKDGEPTALLTGLTADSSASKLLEG